MGDMTAWFTVVTISGIGCALLGLYAVVRGLAGGLPELAILGVTFSSGAIAMTVHGIVGLVDLASLGDIALRFGLPYGLLVAAPVLAPPTRLTRGLLRAWRPYTVATLGGALVLAAVDLVWPGRMMSTDAKHVLLVVTGLGGAVLARRQWYLFRISRNPVSAVVCLGVVGFTASGIALTLSTPNQFWGWTWLVLDAAWFFVTVGALVVVLRTRPGVRDVLEPVAAREPLALFEVGLAPECVAFVAALDRKDPATRDHVVRTSALAVRVAMRLGLPARQVRDIGLGALLHDLGKLVVPDEILTGTDRLTEDEFAMVRGHPEAGAALLRPVPSLRSVAPIVARHHERPDGTGYPAGLASDDIGLAAALVSVCDAWDAMVEDRTYRSGLPAEHVASVLQDGAGTHWFPEAVTALLAEVAVAPRPDAGLLSRAPADLDLYVDDCVHGDPVPVAVAVRAHRT